MSIQPPRETDFLAHARWMQGLHEQALERTGSERLAIYSGTPKIKHLDDAPYPFVANPQFKAWAPLKVPRSWLVIEPGRKPRLLYHQPDDYWHTPPADPAGFWVDAFDIEILRDPDDARRLIGANLDHTVFLGEEASMAREWGFGSINPEPLIQFLHYHRAAKSGYELSCLREASRLGVRAHRAAEQAFRRGASEYAIHQAYLAACDHTDTELPYSNIVALNDHGSVLHYDRLDREPPGERHAFLIDAGASYNGYASDITRTYAADGGLFAEMIEAMDKTQQRLVSGMRNGVDYRDMHLEAHAGVAELLIRFELVNLSPEALVETGVTGTFLPHGLGHLIGLQVHDVAGHQIDAEGTQRPPPEGHPFLRLTRVLEPGYVLTVEPGLYFIDPLLKVLREGPHARAVNWQRIDDLRCCGGIRIEDDVVVQAEGPPENLTRDAFAAA